MWPSYQPGRKGLEQSAFECHKSIYKEEAYGDIRDEIEEIQFSSGTIAMRCGGITDSKYSISSVLVSCQATRLSASMHTSP